MAKTDTVSKSAAKTREINNTATNVAQNTYANAKDLVQTTYENVKDVAQTALGNAQDRVQSRAKKRTAATAAGLGVAQLLFNRGKKQSKKNVKKAQKNLGGVVDTLQDVSGNAVNTLQDTVKPGLVATQAALGAAQVALQKNTRKAQKNLQKAQKNLQELQGPVLESLGDSWEKTQDLVGKSAKKASQGIVQVTSGAQDLRDSVQDRYASYQRRRQRARTLFRWGLVIGIVLALLYTPVPGEEVRRRISEQWEQYKGYMGL